MLQPTTINVLVEREGDRWIAQCLEYDLATQARTKAAIFEEICRFVAEHIDACESDGVDPFALPRAPAEFFHRFETGSPPKSMEVAGRDHRAQLAVRVIES